MNCQQFKDNLHDYFMEELQAEDRRRVEDHAASCDDCGGLMNTARELSCHDFIEFMNDFLENELTPERKAVFERHLAICADCTNYLDSYRKTMQLSVLALGESQPPIPPDVPEELILGILDALGKLKDKDE